MSHQKLSKSLSLFNVWALVLGSIIGWGTFVMPGNLFLPSTGPLGTVIELGIGAFIMIIISLSYGYMIQRFPVAGGEFAYTYKRYGKNHAFVCAWYLGLSYLSIVPLNATALVLISRYLFPGILQHGYLYTIAGWDVYLVEILLASITLILFGWMSTKGIKASGNIQTFLAITLVSSILILVVFALFNLSGHFDNLMPLFSPSQTPINGILSIVAIAPWAYVGFDAIPQAFEEFNFSHKKSFGIMILAILLAGLMYISLNIITAIVVPWKEKIDLKSFCATGYATEVLLGQYGLILLGLALLEAVLTEIIGFYMASSWLIYTLARAKALPSWFSFLHPKYSTPHIKILFIMLFSIVTPWFGR